MYDTHQQYTNNTKKILEDQLEKLPKRQHPYDKWQPKEESSIDDLEYEPDYSEEYAPAYSEEVHQQVSYEPPPERVVQDEVLMQPANPLEGVPSDQRAAIFVVAGILGLSIMLLIYVVLTN